MHARQSVAVPASSKSIVNDMPSVWRGSLQRFRQIAALEREAGHAAEAALYAQLAATRAFRLHPELRIPDAAAEHRHRRNLRKPQPLPFPEAV